MHWFFAGAVRYLIIFVSVAAYLSYGAQAHVSFSKAETFAVLICGSGSHKTIERSFGQDLPPQENAHDCCGDCTQTLVQPGVPDFDEALFAWPIMVALDRHSARIFLRPVFWAGAPPVGPPQA